MNAEGAICKSKSKAWAGAVPKYNLLFSVSNCPQITLGQPHKVSLPCLIRIVFPGPDEKVDETTKALGFYRLVCRLKHLMTSKYEK